MKTRFIALFALIILLSVSPVHAGTESFNRARTYDVLNYVIRLKFDRSAKQVFGDSTVELTPLGEPLNSVELDSEDITYEFVGLDADQSKLGYSILPGKIRIILDRKYEPGEKISLRFRYSAKPAKGIYFVEPLVQGAKVIRAGQIWTQGESEETHHWLPSFDFPDDKATTEQFLTVEKGETAIANGEFLDKKENSDGTQTFHYRMDIPHSVYLTSFVIGEYVKESGKHKDVPLGFYVYPGQESIVPLAFGRTADIMRIFEGVTGVDYPFKKYDQTMVAEFQWGGMENVTATTMADTEILFARIKFGRDVVDDLVSHELAHSWFGNLVTCRNWAELWLNEGFATFMEAVNREKSVGRAAYNNKVKQDALEYLAFEASQGPDLHGLFNKKANASDDDSMFDTVTYQKGGAVVHTLREELGDEAFWKGVNIYLNNNRLKNVETTDLKAAMEEASGKELGWFFDQWIYGSGHPDLKITHYFDLKKKKLRLRISQAQTVVGDTPAAFVLPLTIRIKSANGSKDEVVRVDKRTQDFEFDARTKPQKIEVDPDNKIPVKSVSVVEGPIR
jgi:aminopeptidase N